MDLRAQLRAQLGSQRRKESGTVKGRKRAEKSAMRSPDDGRKLNVAVKKQWKTSIARAKHDYDMAILEIIERTGTR